MTISASPGTTWKAIAAASAWILALLAVIATLHALGRGSLSTPPVRPLSRFGGWLDQRDAATASFALVRIGAQVIASYLLAVTVLGLLARATRRAHLVRLVDVVTMPIARRVLGAVAGAGLSASTAGMLVLPARPAGHHGPPSPTTTSPPAARSPAAGGRSTADDHVVLRRLPDGGTAVMKRLPGTDTTATMRVIDQRPPQPVAPAPKRATPATHEVVPGDSFWTMSRSVLRNTQHRPPDDREIVAYWRTLIEHNRSRLVDPANPNLIYPGQIFELPPPPPT